MSNYKKECLKATIVWTAVAIMAVAHNLGGF